VATVDDNVLEHIEVKKSGDTLVIKPKWNTAFRSATLRVKVTMPNLYKIELSGGSEADVTGFSSSNDLAIDLSGGSHMTGDITAGDSDIDLSGGSQMTGDLTIGDSDIDLSGGSHVTLSSLSGDLNVTGSGGSHITLSGSAENIVIKGSGGSHFNLEDCSVSDADINLSGGSHADVNVNGILNVDLSGESEVIYTGEPTLGDINLSWDSELNKK